MYVDKEPEHEWDKEMWKLRGGPQRVRLAKATENFAELAMQLNLNLGEFDEVVDNVRNYHTSFSVNPNSPE